MPGFLSSTKLEMLNSYFLLLQLNNTNFYFYNKLLICCNKIAIKKPATHCCFNVALNLTIFQYKAIIV